MTSSFEGPQFGENTPGTPEMIEREIREDGTFTETFVLPTGQVSQLDGWYIDGERAAFLDDALRVGQTAEEEVAYLEDKIKEE